LLISLAKASFALISQIEREPHWVYRAIKWCIIVYGSSAAFIVVILNFPILGMFLIGLFWLKVLASGASDYSIVSNGQ
jgi:hypothetical protein